MLPGAVRRFWDGTSVAAEAGGWTVRLDGKPVRLPDGTPLRSPSRALAEAIAAEWAAAGGAKGGEMSFADVPLTRLAGTAQQRIAPDPLPTADALARYGESDLLCYRADGPEALVVRQARGWQPWLDWAAAVYGARLVATAGVMFMPQPPEALDALRAAVRALDPVTLAGLGVLVPVLGSLVLGLAVAAGALGPEEAHRLAVLDEDFEIEQWGEDAEAAARRRNVAAEVADAARLVRLGRAP